MTTTYEAYALVVSRLSSGIDIAEVLSAYFAESAGADPLYGKTLKKMLDRDIASIHVNELRKLPESPSPEIRQAFRDLDPVMRRLLLFSVLNACCYSTLARDKVLTLAMTHDEIRRHEQSKEDP